MADVRIKFNGPEERLSEVAITGQQQVWLRNQSGSVTQANASLLLATGKFTQVPNSRTIDTAEGNPAGVSPDSLQVLANSGITGISINAASFPVFSAAMARTKAGISDTNVIILGESTVVGTGSGGGAGLTEAAYARSTTGQWVRALRNNGYFASADSQFGDHAIAAVQGLPAMLLYQPQLSLGGTATFVADGSLLGLGGLCWQLNAAAEVYNFTPLDVANRADVTYFVTSAAVVTPTFGGAATSPTTITEAANTNAVKTVTLTLPTRGTSVLSIPWTSGNMLFQGVKFWDTERARVNVMNMGVNGLRLDQIFTSTIAYVAISNALAAVDADLVIVDCSINSATVGGEAGLATYSTQLGTLIDTIRSYGSDVMLRTASPIGQGVGPTGVLAQYAAAIRAVGAAKGVKVNDSYTRAGSYAAQLAAGHMGDAVHPNGLLYLEVADADFATLAS